MKNYLNSLLDYVYKLESKIAFYPTLYSLAGIIVAFFMFYIENKGVSVYLIKNFPRLVIDSSDTALNILTTFIAGLISIMVFSFSMVMILLNQASSNFSPRVLPGLISNRRHQKILGVYNATLLYCIFTLIQIEPNQEKYQLPGFSVLLGIVFMTICLGAFIYFIHSISQEIQVSNIMTRIFNTANNRLKKLIESEGNNNNEFENSDQWDDYKTKVSGFMQDVNLDLILDFAKDNKCKFDILKVKGEFVFEDEILFKCNKNLEEEQLETLHSCFQFSSSERVEDNYILAFKQITEIAVKAMSPGINDPGTALICIDYLTELFDLRLDKKDSVLLCEDNQALIKISTVSFKDLLFSVVAPLRTYVKHDVIVVQKLMNMLLRLYKKTTNNAYKTVIKEEANSLFSDAKLAIENKEDLKKIESYFSKF